MEAKEPKAMEEIHRIRVKLYEEEKGLKTKDKISRANKIAEEFAKKYHIENRLIKGLALTAR